MGVIGYSYVGVCICVSVYLCVWLYMCVIMYLCVCICVGLFVSICVCVCVTPSSVSQAYVPVLHVAHVCVGHRRVCRDDVSDQRHLRLGLRHRRGGYTHTHTQPNNTNQTNTTHTDT